MITRGFPVAGEVSSEPVEARLARELGARHVCERNMLGKKFWLNEKQFVITAVDQRHCCADAKRVPWPGISEPTTEYKLLGFPLDELGPLVGCSCGLHPWRLGRRPNKVESRHRSAAFSVLAEGRIFEIWWRDGDDVLRRNASSAMTMIPEFEQQIEALNRFSQQIADLDPNGEPTEA